MVSAKVSDAAGLLSTYSSNSTKNNNSQSVSFTDVLKKNTVENTKTVDTNDSIQTETVKDVYETEENVKETQKDVNVDTDTTEEAVNKLKEELKKSKELDDSTDEVVDDKIPTVEEISKIAHMIVNIKQEISEMLGITVEELDKYLNQLSVDLNQLKQPELMIQLVMKVKNISNQAQLLVNPKLSNEIKELLVELKQIVADMPEVTEEVVKQIQLLNEETVETAGTPTEEMIITDDGNEEFVTYDENSRTEETVEITGESITQKLGDMANTDSGNMSDNAANSSGDDTVFENAMNIANVQNNVEVVDAISEAITRTTGSYGDAEIISQIIERIRVSAKPGMSSMELQLYPEHLGKVTVQVVAKNGGITAQITAENENVRGIIENQLVTLKDSLNEQGIKVDSVEVTVANYGFEQNLNEQGEQGKEQAKHSNRVRKSLLEEISGIVSEEVLEETRMETVGNTVSYKA